MSVEKDPGTGRQQGLKPTVIEIIAEEEKRDFVFFKCSMGMAVAAHLMFFVLNWNFLAFGGDQTAIDEQNQRIYVIKVVKFTPPPKSELPRIRKPETQVIPVPDSNPDDPEPIRDEQPEEVSFFEGSDIIFELPPAPPDPEPEGPIVFSYDGSVTEPVRIAGPDPAYPEAALKAHIGGTVILECVIGKDGVVNSIKVLRERPFGLTESAVRAVERWRFEPSRLNGRPVAVQYILTVKFTAQ